jgi:CheY-like chemotaxis protein
LRLSSEAGAGTTAELILPVTTEASREESPLMTPSADAASPATVLLVDDDALIAMSTTMMLEDLGHRVIEAHSPADALKVLNSSPPVDVLITDHAMPEMTGVELARKARQIHPGLPVLLATGYADLPDSADVGLPRLTKPYGQKQLAVELARLLPSRQ